MGRRILKLSEEDKNIDLSGKTYIVTGANSGVGLETTRQLIKQGGHVVMACRSLDSAKEEAKSFEDLKGSYEIIKIDLSDLDSVRSFVKKFLSKHNKLDGLDCNAGLALFGSEPKYTKAGHEWTFGVNFLGHFLLTELLLDVLKKTKGSRMVIVSSVVHAGSPKKRPKLHLEDMNYKEREYKGTDAYAEVKLADVLYVKELAERIKKSGVSVFAVHPGWARSNFGKEGTNVFMRGLLAVMRPLTMSMSDSNEDSAQTSLHCLISDKALDYSGKYFSQSSVLYRDKQCKNGGWPMESPNPNAHDMDSAHELIALAKKLTGVN